mgnify:CR=1 FL=1
MSEAFHHLARPIQKWIRRKGWDELRPVQVRTILTVIETEADIIVSATTAGGKTEAAFLPLLSDVIDKPSDLGGFDLLYIGPLKALITDQAQRLESICNEADLAVTPWHGDVPASVKARGIENPSGVLLITPESLEALFVRRGTEISRLFAATRAVVLDELHTMLDSERGVHIRSLLTRLELARRNRLRRVGLSATLGEPRLACPFLCGDDPGSVVVIEADDERAELKVQLKAYESGKNDRVPVQAAVAGELFLRLRGDDNLVFAGARKSVETYADRLRRISEEQDVPLEFFPHHASLSREHRDFVEQRLKGEGLPTTAVCTSTLELGIDIGDIVCVAQIGAPFTVSSLRQRIGRSGRRRGKSAILRQYIVEQKRENDAAFADRLRLGLVRSIAMIELMLERWCEPPRSIALHLSTLTHQILSIIAERGGASAANLYSVLCSQGPFRNVDPQLFAEVLRALGEPGTDLIEQATDGILLLGSVGESLVEHYSFYAVFQTSEEYQIVSGGRSLGTMPIENIVAPGMLLIFSGQRWKIVEVDDRDRVVSVKSATGGMPPMFGGEPGDIHDKVVSRMFQILEGEETPAYLDEYAVQLLNQGRRSYAMLGFNDGPLVARGDNSWIVATRVGTTTTTTLSLAMRAKNFEVQTHDGFLEITGGEESLLRALRSIRDGAQNFAVPNDANLAFEKFHSYLTRSLLLKDALSCRLEPLELPSLCQRLLGSDETMAMPE